MVGGMLPCTCDQYTAYISIAKTKNLNAVECNKRSCLGSWLPGAI